MISVYVSMTNGIAHLGLSAWYKSRCTWVHQQRFVGFRMSIHAQASFQSS